MENLNVLWLDLETSGLTPRVDSILEIAAIPMIGGELKLGRRFVRTAVLGRADTCLLREASDPVVQSMHDKSGLWADVAKPGPRVGGHELCKDLEGYIERVYSQKVILAGSSVHFDRNFLLSVNPHLPLHHRVFDVSTLKTYARAALGDPDWPNQPDSEPAHRALDDVMESIEAFRRFSLAFRAV